MTFRQVLLLVSIAFVGAAIALTVFWTVVSYSSGTMCASETYGICIRNWLGALSGYVAAIVAGVTIFYLHRQVAEQIKQNRFLLGDADPTLDAYFDEEAIIYLRIVNWNKRTLVIDKVTCETLTDFAVLRVRIEHRPSDEKLSSTEPVFHPPIRVASYDNRGQAPAICRIDGFVGSASIRPEVVAQFVVWGKLIDERHTPIVLKAAVNLQRKAQRT